MKRRRRVNFFKDFKRDWVFERVADYDREENWWWKTHFVWSFSYPNRKECAK